MPDEVAGVEFGGIAPNEEKSTESSQRNLQMLNNLSVDKRAKAKIPIGEKTSNYNR